MYCGKCGKEAADGAKFCPACGASLQRSAASEGGAVPPQAAKNAFEQRREAKERKKKGGIILGTVLAIVVVVGIAAIILHFVGGSGGKKIPKYVCTDIQVENGSMFGFFEYDENGQKTKLTQWMPTDDTIAEFTFDEYGGQKKIRILSSDGTVVSETKYKNEYEFDKKGNPVEQRQIDEDGKLCTVIKRQFNKKGVIELMKSYSVNEDGKKILDYEITTDEKGSEERFTEYDHDGNVTEVQQYKNKYDDNDNLKKVTAYNSETKAELYTMIYHQEKLSEYLKNKEDFDKRAQEKIEEGK